MYPLAAGWGTSPIRKMGYPPVQVPGQDWGYHQQDRVPPSAAWGSPPGPGPRSGQGGTPSWNRMACTCYAAGGTPLAFTQEDFLVDLLDTGSYP